jgi:hypothetical protein
MTRPTETELRCAEAAGFGSKTQHHAKLRRWVPFRNPAGTLLGFFSVELASGLIIKQGERGDASGKAVWDYYLEFRGKATRDRFQDVVLNLLRSEHPEAFDTLGAP